MFESVPIRFRGNGEEWVIAHELAFKEWMRVMVDDGGGVDHLIKEIVLHGL